MDKIKLTSSVNSFIIILQVSIKILLLSSWVSIYLEFFKKLIASKTSYSITGPQEKWVKRHRKSFKTYKYIIWNIRNEETVSYCQLYYIFFFILFSFKSGVTKFPFKLFRSKLTISLGFIICSSNIFIVFLF